MMKNNKRPLDALKVLGGYYYHCQGYDDHARDSMDYKIVETALKEKEKQEQALKNIKKWILIDLVFKDEEQSINYTFGFYTLVKVIKDKSDYDLLKEVLL